MSETSTDCRSPEGITTGLIDGIIAIARVLAKRDLTPTVVQEALRDIQADEDVKHILTYGSQPATS